MVRMKQLMLWLFVGAWALSAAGYAGSIDRQALVRRHDPVLTNIDPHAPVMLGNGQIGFTADITGLQTFPDAYSSIAPLLTEAQWAWHSFPNPHHYTAKDTLVPVEVRGQTQYYPYMKGWNAAQTNPAFNWIRENPHRFSLGRVALDLRHRDGTPARAADISDTWQRLDLWRGILVSRFIFEGERVEVTSFVHPAHDAIYARVKSRLLADGRLRVVVKFPGVAAAINPDPSDWGHPLAHVSRVIGRTQNKLLLERRIDATRYYAAVGVSGAARIVDAGAHAYRVESIGKDTLTVATEFSQRPIRAVPAFAGAENAVAAHWRAYWTEGGAIDFTGSTDARAFELERRIVLSQYLMAVNAAGSVPPQEEGLFSNSWNGKFHLEMHPWHAAHFALWGHADLLERSMGWYLAQLPAARARAKSHGVRGAWWPKMVGPDGVDSPSKVSPFLMWQQPHPIFLAELIWRARRDGATLKRYGELVAATADLLASYPHRDEDGRLTIGPPLIPAQENWNPMTTFNPAFESAYFRWGIETAQKWRERAGLARRADWDAALKDFAPLPQTDGLLLPTGSKPDFWRESASDACRGHADGACMNLDHPSFLMALGYLPGVGVDRAMMARTFDETLRVWDLRQTWGWDYPMMAMTAARLGEPDRALDMLFYPGRNNQYGVTGMTPRVHTAEHGASFTPSSAKDETSPDGPGYRRAAETYFPSNGGLLMAAALMAAGWDGETAPAPGFPKQGWHVRAEGIAPLP